MKTLKRAFRRTYARLLFSYGNRYTCVFCGKSFSKFLNIATA